MLKEYSNKVILLIALIFTFSFTDKILEVINNESTCVCAYDGFGYYLYLPALIENGDLIVTPEWAQDIQDQYCNGTTAYQIVKHHDYPNHLNVYHMGLSLLQAPAYLVGKLFAALLGYPQDGFSKPYHVTYLINALLFIFLGLFYLKKLLLLFFKDVTSAILIAILFVATNTYITFTHQFELPHLYLFFINAAFAYHLFKFNKSGSQRNLLWSAALLGLSSSIRPTQVLLGIVPLFLLIKQYRLSRTFWKSILIFPLLGILFNLPQIIYWKIVGDHYFIPNLHLEEIILVDPHLTEFLFSYRKGWLLYTPFFLLLIPAFIVLFKKSKDLFYILATILFVYIYVMSSWECWWYAASFSSRVMVDIYPILLIPIGFLLEENQSKIKKTVLWTFISLAGIVNLYQSYQFNIGILSPDRMTREHYFYILGKSNVKDYSHERLIIDRGNIDWPQFKYPEGMYVDKKTIFEVHNLKTLPGEPLTVGRFTVFDKLRTDETLLEIRAYSKTSDSTQSIVLQFETVSPFNCYSWNNMELSFGKSTQLFEESIYRYNIPDIHHKGDEIQIYTYTTSLASLEIEKIEIVAYSLIRD